MFFLKQYDRFIVITVSEKKIRTEQKRFGLIIISWFKSNKRVFFFVGSNVFDRIWLGIEQC